MRKRGRCVAQLQWTHTRRVVNTRCEKMHGGRGSGDVVHTSAEALRGLAALRRRSMPGIRGRIRRINSGHFGIDLGAAHCRGMFMARGLGRLRDLKGLGLRSLLGQMRYLHLGRRECTRRAVGDQREGKQCTKQERHESHKAKSYVKAPEFVFNRCERPLLSKSNAYGRTNPSLLVMQRAGVAQMR